MTTSDWKHETNYLPCAQILISLSFWYVQNIIGSKSWFEHKVIDNIKSVNFDDLYHVAKVGLTIKYGCISYKTWTKATIDTLQRKLRKFVRDSCLKLTFPSFQLGVGTCAILPGGYELNYNC